MDLIGSKVFLATVVPMYPPGYNTTVMFNIQFYSYKFFCSDLNRQEVFYGESTELSGDLIPVFFMTEKCEKNSDFVIKKLAGDFQPASYTSEESVAILLFMEMW